MTLFDDTSDKPIGLHDDDSKELPSRPRSKKSIRTISDAQQGDIVRLSGDNQDYRVAWFTKDHVALYPATDSCIAMDGRNLIWKRSGEPVYQET